MAVLAFEISRSALKMIKSGEAFLSSGGVRNIAGQFIELAKPAALNSLNQLSSGLTLLPGMSAVNVASSLTANVQSAFLQHSVNIANAKLDNVISRLGEISKAMNGLHTIQTLSWINSAFSLANCGISIAGFYLTMKKMEGIHGQLSDFFDRYRQDRQSDRIRDYEEILMDLKADLAYIAQLHREDSFDRQVFETREEGIEKDLNNARAFLLALKDDFQMRRIDGQMGCEMIFTLLAVYSQLFNEYACWYYYVHKTRHALYMNWYKPLDEIESSAFKKSLGQFFTFSPEHAAISQVRKAQAINIIFEGVSQQKARLQACESAIVNLPMREFTGVDMVMNQRVTDCIATDLLKITPEALDEIVTQRIMNINLDGEENDHILFPIAQDG